jgi:hypothetical protein
LIFKPEFGERGKGVTVKPQERPLKRKKQRTEREHRKKKRVDYDREFKKMRPQGYCKWTEHFIFNVISFVHIDNTFPGRIQ